MSLLLFRSFVARLVNSAFPRFGGPPFPPALAYAGFPSLDHGYYEDEMEEEEGNRELEDAMLNAVPKRRISHRRKRIKFFPKHLKPIQTFTACKNCGEKHPQHYQLCPFCQPFNNFLRTKDHPAKEEDRLRREYELKKQEQILLARLEESKQQGDSASKPPTTSEDKKA
ncbi:ribosomal protein L32 [Batrachochytrium salamandrivorans]|nr:ribosomal protein L32 [Batrachochytrium salamandrivorans]